MAVVVVDVLEAVDIGDQHDEPPPARHRLGTIREHGVEPVHEGAAVGQVAAGIGEGKAADRAGIDAKGFERGGKIVDLTQARGRDAHVEIAFGQAAQGIMDAAQRGQDVANEIDGNRDDEEHDERPRQAHHDMPAIDQAVEIGERAIAAMRDRTLQLRGRGGHARVVAF